VELFVIISVVLSSAFLGGANVHLIALVTSNRLVDGENPGPTDTGSFQKETDAEEDVGKGWTRAAERPMPQAAMR
jgi:hypothetical protein